VIKKLLLILLVSTLLTGNIFSSGFQINEHGAKAMAMAGAFTGLANDASAVYFNPAGITQLNGTYISAGTTLILPMSKFNGIEGAQIPGLLEPAQEYEMESQVFTPINFYLTQQITDELFVGLSVNNPYGLGTKWDDQWAGRYIAVDTELRTFFFNLVLAYKLTENLSLSGGVVYAMGDVKIIRKLFLADPGTGQVLPDAQTNLEGDGNAIGWTAGLFYMSEDKKSSIGISVRSEVEFDFEGDAITTPETFGITVAPNTVVPSPLPNGAIKATLTTPMTVTAGFAAQISDFSTLTGDIQWTGWSSYDTLAVDFLDYPPQHPILNPTGNAPKQRLASAREYKNNYIFRLGLETEISKSFMLRGGILYDTNPVPDRLVEPTLPDSDRLGLNIGFGYQLTEGLSVDVAYMFLKFVNRTISDSNIDSGYPVAIPFNGTYKSISHLFGVNFSYML
jgi:long-chain fatty acid transport protein